jgi:hypothetical protein
MIPDSRLHGNDSSGKKEGILGFGSLILDREF